MLTGMREFVSETFKRPVKMKRMQAETDYFMTKWKDVYESGDPYYNPNLSLTKFDYSFGRNGD